MHNSGMNVVRHLVKGLLWPTVIVAFVIQQFIDLVDPRFRHVDRLYTIGAILVISSMVFGAGKAGQAIYGAFTMRYMPKEVCLLVMHPGTEDRATPDRIMYLGTGGYAPRESFGQVTVWLSSRRKLIDGIAEGAGEHALVLDYGTSILLDGAAAWPPPGKRTALEAWTANDEDPAVGLLRVVEGIRRKATRVSVVANWQGVDTWGTPRARRAGRGENVRIHEAGEIRRIEAVTK